MINVPAPQATPALAPADERWWRAGPWRFGNRQAASFLVRDLVPAWPEISRRCPRCALDGNVLSVLDHLLQDHGGGFTEAAEWLEAVDADLFSLAIHHLALESRRQIDRDDWSEASSRPSVDCLHLTRGEERFSKGVVV